MDAFAGLGASRTVMAHSPVGHCRLTSVEGRGMPLDIKSTGDADPNQGRDFRISLARMLPTILPDGGDGIEYQYAFLRDNRRIGGLGIFGDEVTLDASGGREKLYTVHLTRASDIESVLHFKRAIGNEDDDFSFIRSIAQGLVEVFARSRSNVDPQCNRVTTTVDALAQNGVGLPEGASVLSECQIILAENLVPGRER